jgi:hypothetical protein
MTTLESTLTGQARVAGTKAPTIVVEDDPTPFILSLAHVLRLSAGEEKNEDILTRLGRSLAQVSVQSGTKTATLSFERNRVAVAQGMAAAPRCVVVLDSGQPKQFLECSPLAGLDEDEFVYALCALFLPTVPDWESAAREFWTLTADSPGMPDCLTITSTEGTSLILGEGAGVGYQLHSDPVTLARVFAGLDPFLDQVVAGSLYVRGTMPQLSVMTGAFWKVQFHG